MSEVTETRSYSEERNHCTDSVRCNDHGRVPRRDALGCVRVTLVCWFGSTLQGLNPISLAVRFAKLRTFREQGLRRSIGGGRRRTRDLAEIYRETIGRVAQLAEQLTLNQ